ncbi:PP2C family protein-serine/threonine phosphatase [Angustibacter aerolatus]
MQLSVGAATDVGRVRSDNEDAYVATAPVYFVADGMGGHAAGEVASALVVEALADLAGRTDLTPSQVVDQLVEANERVVASARTHPEREGMGTTVTGVAVVVVDGAERLAVCNVGDSRVYELRDDRLRQVSRDDSLVQELVDAGVLSPAEAMRHPNRNIVTRSMGRDDLEGVQVELVEPAAGQRFVVCSDGLSDEVEAGTIRTVLLSCPDAGDAARALVQVALDAGGHDNVTVLVLDVVDPGRAGA